MYGAVQTARTEEAKRGRFADSANAGKPSHKTAVQQSANLNGGRLRLLNELGVRVLLHQSITHLPKRSFQRQN